jgi:hypothetical protein
MVAARECHTQHREHYCCILGCGVGPDRACVLGAIEQPGDAVYDVWPDPGLVIDVGLSGEILIAAAVGGQPCSGAFEEPHHRRPRVLDSHRVGGVGGDLLDGACEHFSRDRPFVREVAIRGSGSGAGMACDVV